MKRAIVAVLATLLPIGALAATGTRGYGGGGSGGGSGITALTGDVTASGTGSVSATAAALQGNITTLNNAGGITVTGQETVVGSMTVLGAFSVPSAQFNGGTIPGNAITFSNGALVIQSTTTTTGSPTLQVNNQGGTEIFRVEQDGRVGISTAAPTDTLSVVGSINVTSGLKWNTSAGTNGSLTGSQTMCGGTWNNGVYTGGVACTAGGTGAATNVDNNWSVPQTFQSSGTFYGGFAASTATVANPSNVKGITLDANNQAKFQISQSSVGAIIASGQIFYQSVLSANFTGSTTTVNNVEFAVSTATIYPGTWSGSTCIEFRCTTSPVGKVGAISNIKVRFGTTGGVSGSVVAAGQAGANSDTGQVASGHVCRYGVGTQTFGSIVSGGANNNTADIEGGGAGKTSVTDTGITYLVCTMQSGNNEVGDMNFNDFRVTVFPQ